MRTIQGHPGGGRIDPQFQSNSRIPYNWTEFIYHVGAFRDLQSISLSGLIARALHNRERQTRFFTAVNTLDNVTLAP